MQRSSSITDLWQVLLSKLGSVLCGKSIGSGNFPDAVARVGQRLSNLVVVWLVTMAASLSVFISEMKTYVVQSHFQSNNSAGAPGLLVIPVAARGELVGVAWTITHVVTLLLPSAIGHLQTTADVTNALTGGTNSIATVRAFYSAENFFVPIKFKVDLGQNLYFVLACGPDSTCNCVMQLHFLFG